MTLIKIINGMYGYRPAGSRHAEPKQAGDPPFEVDEAEAKRLIGLKVAAYAAEAESGEEAPPVYDAEMKLEDLKTIAAYYGVDASAMRKKQEVVDAIDKKLAGGEIPGDDGGNPGSGNGVDEGAPALSAEDPVL